MHISYSPLYIVVYKPIFYSPREIFLSVIDLTKNLPEGRSSVMRMENIR